MRALSALELLGIWERGRTLAPVQRALELLAAACPETPPDALAGLSIGQRDIRLLELRERLFGPRVTGLVACSRCGGNVELTFDIHDVLDDCAKEPEAETSLNIEGYELRFRLPNSEDLAVAVEKQDVAGARELMLRRCLLSVLCDGRSAAFDELPSAVLEAVSDRLAKADPLADIQLAVSCPCCEHNWRSGFDIVSFLWTEIDAWARRVLYEVHALARAYGWGEREVLALSGFRRQLYLQMVGA
jgi:hypothetical protein